jgi:FMN-dependent NADH-azoreductase
MNNAAQNFIDIGAANEAHSVGIGPMQAFDFQEPYLRAVLGFIGMDDIRVVRIEGVAKGEAALARGVHSARAQANQVVRELLPTEASPKERVAA